MSTEPERTLGGPDVDRETCHMSRQLRGQDPTRSLLGAPVLLEPALPQLALLVDRPQSRRDPEIDPFLGRSGDRQLDRPLQLRVERGRRQGARLGRLVGALLIAASLVVSCDLAIPVGPALKNGPHSESDDADQDGKHDEQRRASHGRAPAGPGTGRRFLVLDDSHVNPGRGP